MVNGGPDPVAFVVQADGGTWNLAIDTARPSPDDIGVPRPLAHASYTVEGRAIVVLVRISAR
jgi:hypothetical protein